MGSLLGFVCTRIGPRGPAVTTFWLPTTGAPATVVGYFWSASFVLLTCPGLRLTLGRVRPVAPREQARHTPLISTRVLTTSPYCFTAPGTPRESNAGFSKSLASPQRMQTK